MTVLSRLLARRLVVCWCMLCACCPAAAQSVGLVLSGGGAKGLTHIGIIRALEENSIPIDYIAGTSMGAIIGSLYAMGYSPDEMEQLLTSDEFRRWYTAQVDEEYIYYFKKNEPTPEFVNLKLNFRNLKESKPQLLPTSVVDPIQMNLAFLELYAPATAACQGDFDRLFVPFRCVASDVYNKRQLVMQRGDLGDAVRASMSFPLMFKPIEIDSVLTYDGGIYNNFPTDVMRDHFHPDFIIGSIVASNPSKPNEKDIVSQLENMIMQKTDYSLDDSLGVLMTFRYTDVSLMDFDRLRELHDKGYKRTLELMDTIQQRVHRRVNPENVRLRRLIFRSELPELQFRHVEIEGTTPVQSRYVQNELHDDAEEVFSFESFKKSYFRLLADNVISEIIPHAVYRPDDGTFDLRLRVKMEDNFSVRVGGSVSSSMSNQMYFGLSYHDLRYYSKEFTFDGQLGKVYNNLQFSARIDFPTSIPTSYRFIASTSKFDYFKRENLFATHKKPAFTKKTERFAKLKVALPFLSKKKAEFSLGVAQIEDRYVQGSIVDFDNKERFDLSRYFLYGGSVFFGGSTLDSRNFPTKGSSETLIAQIYASRERFLAGTDSIGKPQPVQNHTWLQLSYRLETYRPIRPHFVLGIHLEALYSSRNFAENYTATMLQAAEFAPTPHSRYTYNEAFRANQFFAAGIKPIYTISNTLQVRTELYGFLPIFPIHRNALGKAYYGRPFSKFEYMGELSVVYRLPFGAISAYVNHYSAPAKAWNYGITLGWQLFNLRFVE